MSKTIFVLCLSMVSAILAAALEAASLKYFQYNLFGLIANMIIPLGAILLGLVAGAGFFLAALRADMKADVSTYGIIGVIAAATQALIYYAVYLDFKTGSLTGQLGGVGFMDFTRAYIEHQHYRINNHGHVLYEGDGEMGRWGYGIALLQYAGLVLGGIAYHSILRMKPTCVSCGRYEKQDGETLVHTFNDVGEAAQFVATLHDARIEDLAPMLPAQNRIGKKKASFVCYLRLVGCADCQTQALVITFLKRRGSALTAVPELGAKRPLPQGHDLRHIFVVSTTV